MRYLRLCVIKADMDYLQLVCLRADGFIGSLCRLLFIDWCLIKFYSLKYVKRFDRIASLRFWELSVSSLFSVKLIVFLFSPLSCAVSLCSYLILFDELDNHL